MRVTYFIWLTLICKIYAETESDGIPIATTDDFHGDYMGDIDEKNELWKQNINDTLNSHHLHPKLAITPTLSEYSRLSSPLNTDLISSNLKIDNIDNWINISGEDLKAISLEGKEVNQLGFEMDNNSIKESDKVHMSLSKDINGKNNQSNQTAEIPVAQDVAVALKCKGKCCLFTLIIFFSFLT
ncbi:hypothetical protein C6P44_003597 [Monosporozyma unispora]|nr:hypothetical protein C6P44_003597 [Kazachstania unispora]